MPVRGLGIQPRPALDRALHGRGLFTEVVAAAGVALDAARRDQPGQRHAQCAAGEAEECAGRDQGPHGHAAVPERREQIEDQAAGARGDHTRNITQ